MVEITPASAPGPLTGNVLFYSRPEPLSSETHMRMGVRRIARPFGFAAGHHVAPLAVTEFPMAAINYPIIFAGDNFQPLAVMGVNPRENMFIRADGLFDPGVYIPAYIRRYPFVLAADPAQVAADYGVTGRFAIAVIGTDGNLDFITTRIVAGERIRDMVYNNYESQSAARKIPL